MGSPIRRTTSPLASSPLALPVLHLGSFSDLQLGGSFSGDPKDVEPNGKSSLRLPHIPPANPHHLPGQRPYTPSIASPSSAAKLSPGIPFLRDSTINRRKTIITPSTSHPTSPLRTPTTPLTLDIPPPLPLKDQPPRGTPSPITDHPDYADFVYRPQGGASGMMIQGEERGYAWGGTVGQSGARGYDQQVSQLFMRILWLIARVERKIVEGLVSMMCASRNGARRPRAVGREILVCTRSSAPPSQRGPLSSSP